MGLRRAHQEHRRTGRRTVAMRAKLALASICVLIMGLMVLIWFSMMGIRHYLGSEIDDDLYTGRDSVERMHITGDPIALLAWTDGLGQQGSAASRDSILAMTDASGTALALPYPNSQPDAAQRALVAAMRDEGGFDTRRKPTTVRVAGRDYRVIAGRLGDAYLLLAKSTDDVDAVVENVVHLELLVGGVLVLCLGTFIYVGARWRLRPLEDMVETASEVAEGGPDLSRRVAPRKKSFSEVEQLRTALNAMLQQVETAFVSREHAAAHLKRFVADASHELRTPLAAIRGYLQLYEKGMLADEDERKRALSRMGAEAERMARLVDELLALARLDQRPQLRPQRVDLARLVRGAVADFSAQQPARTVHLDLPDECLVLADEATLCQIIANLLVNVRAHTPVSADVFVSVAAVEPNGDGRARGVLRVRDEGPGMRAEDAERIFDRFFRAARDTSGAGTGADAGSGLGMAVVRAAVAANDGEVAVETAPGEGLTVTVGLPAASHSADTP